MLREHPEQRRTVTKDCLEAVRNEESTVFILVIKYQIMELFDKLMNQMFLLNIYNRNSFMDTYGSIKI